MCNASVFSVSYLEEAPLLFRRQGSHVDERRNTFGINLTNDAVPFIQGNASSSQRPQDRQGRLVIPLRCRRVKHLHVFVKFQLLWRVHREVVNSAYS
jgi:hypothetical protein